MGADGRDAGVGEVWNFCERARGKQGQRLPPEHKLSYSEIYKVTLREDGKIRSLKYLRPWRVERKNLAPTNLNAI